MIELSVIVPTYNRLSQLQQVLAALEYQTFPMEAFEVIVVSDGSNDGTDEYLANLRTPYRLSPVTQVNQGPAMARNVGIDRAQGKWTLFLDDDVVPVPVLLAEHYRVLQQNAKVVVLGPMLIPPGIQLAPWIVWEARTLEKQYRAIVAGRWQSTARQFYTGNTSLARELLVSAGGFDPLFHRAEDVELAYRLEDLDVQFVFVPEAIGYHYARRSYQSWSNIAYAYGHYDVVMAHYKGRPWLLPAVLREFKLRHPLIQWLVQLCLGRKRLGSWLIESLKWLAELSMKVHLEEFSCRAYSGIFNLRYYQGIADTLGGAEVFWRAAAQEEGSTGA